MILIEKSNSVYENLSSMVFCCVSPAQVALCVQVHSGRERRAAETDVVVVAHRRASPTVAPVQDGVREETARWEESPGRPADNARGTRLDEI